MTHAMESTARKRVSGAAPAPLKAERGSDGYTAPQIGVPRWLQQHGAERRLSPAASLDASVAAMARSDGEAPSLRIPARPASVHGGRSVAVYDTPAAHRAAEQMGVVGFSYRGDVFLGRDLDRPGRPGRDRVLEHEVTHALQARQGGAPAGRDALEGQAGSYRGQGPLLAADPEAVYGWLWIPAIIAFGYIMTRPNTANAPKPGDKLYPSLTTGDYAKMIAEATFLAGAGVVAGSIRKAGYSMVTAWGGSGAIGSIGFRAISDIHAGKFSGIKAYVVDGLTGAVVGIVVGGTFYAAGNLPGLSRVKDWWGRGAENDAAWAKLSAKDKWLYEIGQKTLPKCQWEPLANLSPVERGRAIVDQRGWLRALFPQSGGFMNPGAGGTLSTGPTPMFRQWMPRILGATSGAMGRHGVLPEWEKDLFGPSPEGGQSFNTGTQGSLLPPPDAPAMCSLPEEVSPLDMPAMCPVPEEEELSPYPSEGEPGAEGGAFVAPPGWDTIIVVPEGKEMEYLIKTGKIGDFPAPSASGDVAV